MSGSNWKTFAGIVLAVTVLIAGPARANDDAMGHISVTVSSLPKDLPTDKLDVCHFEICCDYYQQHKTVVPGMCLDEPMLTLVTHEACTAAGHPEYPE
jgi:hypothetical protein